MSDTLHVCVYLLFSARRRRTEMFAAIKFNVQTYSAELDGFWLGSSRLGLVYRYFFNVLVSAILSFFLFNNLIYAFEHASSSSLLAGVAQNRHINKWNNENGCEAKQKVNEISKKKNKEKTEKNKQFNAIFLVVLFASRN